MEYCISILKYAQQYVSKRDAKFVVVLLDNLNTFLDWDKQGNPWLLFASELGKQGIDYWYYDDLLYKQFKSNRGAVINKGLVHYTPQANDMVANFLSDKIIDGND
ncbi:MAG: hypothetical protein KF725_03560 [Cyclobacteriaceae bacterium]|nr:hypothetical protein [Cyclobacteriaceae bacterium]